MQLSSGIGRRNELPVPVAIVRRHAGLSRILGPELNVCVWKRTLPPRLEKNLEILGRTLVHDAVASVTRDARSVLPLFEGLPDNADTRSWTTDVAALVSIFCELLGTRSARASLASVETNKCRKFHSDYKTLRLVCTYAGPGTEWVDDRHVDRRAMGHEEACFDSANARIVRRGDRIQRARPGDVVVLKGELFAGNAGRGAVHRSPPIEATGERRIVLTLDKA